MLSKATIRSILKDWLNERCREAARRGSSLVSSEGDFAVRISSVDAQPEVTTLVLEIGREDDLKEAQVSFSVHSGKPMPLSSALGSVLVDTAVQDGGD